MKRNTIIAFVVGTAIGFFVMSLISDSSFDFFQHQNGEIHDPEGQIGQSGKMADGKVYYAGYFKHGRGFLERNNYRLYLSETPFSDKQRVCFSSMDGEKVALIIGRDDGDEIEFKTNLITDLLPRGNCPH